MCRLREEKVPISGTMKEIVQRHKNALPKVPFVKRKKGEATGKGSLKSQGVTGKDVIAKGHGKRKEGDERPFWFRKKDPEQATVWETQSFSS